MTTWLTQEIARIQTLVQAGIVLAAICFVGYTFWKTKQLVATLAAMVLAGAVIWASTNITWFADRAGEETASVPTVVSTTVPAVIQVAGAALWTDALGAAALGGAATGDAFRADAA